MPIIRYFTILLAIGFAAAAYYMFSGDQNFEKHPSLQVRQDTSNPEMIVFSWSGSIDAPMASEISKEFKKWRHNASHFLIELDSPGGSVDEGGRVVSEIDSMKKTHIVWTYVGPGKDCLSMCVPIYLQGRLRIASSTSMWLFHDARAVDKYTGAEVVMYAHELNQANFDFLSRYINRSEINQDWLDGLKIRLRAGDVWKTGQELKDERSNIVMVLEG